MTRLFDSPLLWCGMTMMLLRTATSSNDHASSDHPTHSSSRICTTDQHWQDHPILCGWLDRKADDESALAQELYTLAEEAGLLVELLEPTIEQMERQLRTRPELSPTVQSTTKQSSRYPIVLAHGMGDSCFNSGMKGITQHLSDLLNVYAVCIPTGATQAEDTTNGYFLNMDASVDAFYEGVAADPNLRNGFHAMGFSQGNNVIRGYIAKYNNDDAGVVQTFLSVNGVNAGIGAVPYCRPGHRGEQGVSHESIHGRGGMCNLLMEQASRRAYTEFAQEHSFQANYWRDPRPESTAIYQQYSQLAVYNNEVPENRRNATLVENWSKTGAFVWVLAEDDNMVFPREGEQWAAPNPSDPFDGNPLSMKETEWYKMDLFGLRTADEQGRNYFESFAGDHLQFSMEDLNGWVTKYFT